MRFLAARPSTAVPVVVADDVELTLHDRRARAADRAWLLMPTSIPTSDILASYLDDVLQP